MRFYTQAPPSELEIAVRAFLASYGYTPTCRTEITAHVVATGRGDGAGLEPGDLAALDSLAARLRAFRVFDRAPGGDRLAHPSLWDEAWDAVTFDAYQPTGDETAWLAEALDHADALEDVRAAEAAAIDRHEDGLIAPDAAETTAETGDFGHPA